MHFNLEITIKNEAAKLLESTFSNPPDDYAGFMSAVGRWRGLLDVLDMIKEDRRARRDDEA